MILSVIIVLICLFICFIRISSRKEREQRKIFHVYSQPAKWYYLKYIIIYVFLSFRKVIQQIMTTVKYKTELQYVEQFEKLKQLSEHDKAFDATFLHAVTQNGFYICGGLERRHLGKVNGLLYLIVPGLGLLESEKLPNTLLDADPTSVLLLDRYSAEGLSFAPVKPMQLWKLEFDGKMRLHQKFVRVKLDAEWTSDFPHFFVENDISLWALSRALAREEWTSDFFKTLKGTHQKHYEQMGYLKGTLVVDDEEYKLEMDSFRDHSFGYKRDWTLMHRYIFHMFYLSDQTRITIGVVSQPCTTSDLLVGNVVLPNKKIYPIDNCDLQLYQHGEEGNPGKNLAFCFEANGNTYEAKIDVIYESTHYKGNDVEAKLIERFFTCEVNGVKGRGIAEWHYNNVKNRTT